MPRRRVQRPFDGQSYGAQGEVGIRLGLDRFYAEPVVSAAYIRTDLNNLNALDRRSTSTISMAARQGGAANRIATDLAIAELFDVVVLPGVGCPMSLGIGTLEIENTIHSDHRWKRLAPPP